MSDKLAERNALAPVNRLLLDPGALAPQPEIADATRLARRAFVGGTLVGALVCIGSSQWAPWAIDAIEWKRREREPSALALYSKSYSVFRQILGIAEVATTQTTWSHRLCVPGEDGHAIP